MIEYSNYYELVIKLDTEKPKGNVRNVIASKGIRFVTQANAKAAAKVISTLAGVEQVEVVCVRLESMRLGAYKKGEMVV